MCVWGGGTGGAALLPLIFSISTNAAKRAHTNTHTNKNACFFWESASLQLPAAVGWSCLSVPQHRGLRLLAPQLSSI